MHALQDIVRQLEQGSAKVLQAVDWPQSSSDGHKEQEGQGEEHEASTEPNAQGEVCGLLFHNIVGLRGRHLSEGLYPFAYVSEGEENCT
jgi:hypothetical protein